MEVWIPVIVAVVSATASGVFAYRANVSKQNADRMRDLEARIASRKVATYDPMFELFTRLLDPRTSATVTDNPEQYAKAISEFSQQLAVWGSDDAMIAFQRFMQTTYRAAPAPVMMRHYVEFVLAARRDLGYDSTKITGEHILGVRVNDYYDGDDIRGAMEASLSDVYAKHSWTPPWT